MINKKGSVLDLVVWTAVILVAIIFFAGWIYSWNIIKTNMESITEPIGTQNDTIGSIAHSTIGSYADSLSQLKFIALCMFIGMCLSILITNFFIKGHPAYFIFYTIIMIILIIIAIVISNFYADILQMEGIGEVIQTFTAIDYFMLELPYVYTIIGFLGAILLYINFQKDDGSYF